MTRVSLSAELKRLGCLVAAVTLVTATAASASEALVATAGEVRIAGEGSSFEVRRGNDGTPVRFERGDRTIRDLRLLHAVGDVLFASWREGAGNERIVIVSIDSGRSWTSPRRVDDVIALRSGRQGEAEEPSFAEELLARPTSRLRIVQFETRSLAAYRARLVELGADLLGYVPNQAHIVRMSPAAEARIAGEPFVRQIRAFHPAQRISEELLAELDSRVGTDEELVRYRLQTFTPGSREKRLLGEAVERLGATVVAEIPNGHLLEAMLSRSQVMEIMHSDHLAWIQVWTAPEPDMDIVRATYGPDYIEGVAGYDGTGVRGEVMDLGVQETHQDFDGIIIHNGPPNFNAHGTCTYGIVFGNGDRDVPSDGDPRATGLLPAAQGYFANTPGDRYAHTAELIVAPIEAVFQSNSWGGGRTRAYDSVSAEMDDIIWINDFVIYQSQSNAGNQDSRPQAWAKNIISVGGVRHYDTADTSDDCWCTGASIGPAEDGRVKPDLMHFYDATWTTDAEPNGYNAGANYTDFGGTSGATPIIAGLGGLVFEMWADNIYGNNPVGSSVFEKRPHPSTLKAIMINTADQYPFSGPTGDLTRMHQGWGVPNVQNVLDRAPLTKIINENYVLRDLEWNGFVATVPAGQGELKVTMVYTDRPGNPAAAMHRVNDVTLRVEAPDGTEYWGNNGLMDGVWSVAGGVADQINTVENVFIQNPIAGDWKIEIYADEVAQDVHVETPEDDQDYALVVYGVTDLVECRAAVPPPTGTTALATADNEITVSWSGSATSFTVLRALGGCSEPLVPIATVPGAQTSYVDSPVSGGSVYGYVVRAVEGCESLDSVCVEMTTTGPCLLDTTFAGIESAVARQSTTCGVDLAWSPTTSACGGQITYNVYRSTDPAFVPGAANRIASCLAGLSHVDTSGLVFAQDYTYVVRAEDSGGQPNGAPCGGREELNIVRLAARPVGTPSVIYSTDFEAGLGGWTVATGTPPATTGLFLVGDPVGTTSGGDLAQPEDDHTGVGVSCLYTAENPAAGLGTDDVDSGEVVATSPSFDGSAFSIVRLNLWRWHFNRDLGEDAEDYFAIDASNDGGSNWVNVETLDENRRANDWNLVTIDLDRFLALTNDMRVRVRASDGGTVGNIIESAIDDVEIAGANSCSGVSAPGVISGIPGPLLAVRIGAQVRFVWGQDCAGSPRYGIYHGDIDTGLSSLQTMPGLCDVSGLTMDIALDPGDRFYLVAPNDGSFEGSLGIGTFPVRRPPAATPCYPRAPILDSCAP